MDLVHDRGSMDPVRESGPWIRYKEGVHGPLVRVLSSPPGDASRSDTINSVAVYTQYFATFVFLVHAQ